MDKQWFHQQLHDQHKSLRKLADFMEAAPSSVSRLLSGQRRMQLPEAQQIALFLNCPVPEVLRHAGLNLDKSGAEVAVKYIITDDGTLKPTKAYKITTPSFIDAHKENLVAASFQCSSGPLSLWDDALAIFQTPDDAIQPEAVGHLAMVVKQDGTMLICNLERARRDSTASLKLVSGKRIEAKIKAASAVIAVVP